MACEEDKIPVTPMAIITVVGINVCLVVAFGVAALFHMAARNFEAERIADSRSSYADSIATQREAVETGSIGGMSVDRAMDRVVANAAAEAND